MFFHLSIRETLFAVTISATVYFFLTSLQRLYFHPLSRYPGPRIWAISRLPFVLTLLRGTLVQRTKELHDRYGDAVRIAPNEVSFSSAQAWQDIYAHHQGSPNFPKNPLWMAPGANGIHSILSANDADHARYRRLLSHAFSEKALMQQEDLLQSYIELLVNRLSEKCATSGTAVVDMVQWLNFMTFDIIGDLSLGESFGCLQESKYHGWVSILFKQFKAAAFLISFRFYKLDRIIKKMLSKSLIQKQMDHINYANERIARRMDQGEAGRRNDFMTYVQRYNDEKGMSVPEIEATFRTLVLVGSETTATALSGIIGNLIRYPDVLAVLSREIRDSFSAPSEIRANRVSKLPYLGAVIEEGLRLCPPVPLGMPRVVPPGGSDIGGERFSEGTFVSASGYTSNRSSANFPDSPASFDPSRWLDPSRLSGYTLGAFNPFSLGPRNCLGRNLAYLEMRLVLSHLLWAFEFKTSEGRCRKWEEQRSWILWDKQALDVEIKLRKI